MRKKLYIETSVWNQLEHTDRPDWNKTAHRFMTTLKEGYYEPYISFIVLDEIGRTPDETLRRRLIDRIDNIQPTVLDFDDEAAALTELFMESAFKGSKSLRIYNDCSHVAIATVNQIKHIVSFNCDHLVNDRRIDGFNAIIVQNGYDLFIDISTPEKFNMIPLE